MIIHKRGKDTREVNSLVGFGREEEEGITELGSLGALGLKAFLGRIGLNVGSLLRERGLVTCTRKHGLDEGHYSLVH